MDEGGEQHPRIDKDSVIENCLKILRTPTHQNGLKFSTFLHIYKSKFDHPFPFTTDLDTFFSSFATASSNTQV